MKAASNITQRVGLASSLVATVALLLAPVSAFAAPTSTPNKPAPQPSTSPFCTQLPSKSATITNQVNAMAGKLQAAWSKQTQDLTNNFQNVDQTVAANRAKWDSERQQDFGKLEAKATTTAQKQAVQTYENAVLQAVNTHRSAIDAARSTFRTSVQGAVSGRQSTVSGQLSTFEAAVNSALSTAQASCASNPSQGATIRTTLIASLKTARTTFENNRNGDAQIGAQVKQFADTRTASFKAADSAFQAALQNARQTLQQAFGKNTV